MKQPITQDHIVWQLPMVSAENNNTGCIHGNAKPHAFTTCDDNLVNWSLYSQYSKEYETINIEKVEEKHLCKKCLNSYKKLKKKEGNNNGA